MTECLGTFSGVEFEVSTATPPGSFVVDSRLGRALGVDMSAMYFRRQIAEHKMEKVTFAWDIRERAREIFYCIANGYDSFIAVTNPIEVVVNEANTA